MARPEPLALAHRLLNLLRGFSLEVQMGVWANGVAVLSVGWLASCVTQLPGQNCAAFIPSDDAADPPERTPTTRLGEDMLFESGPQTTSASAADLWPNGQIPYSFGQGFLEGFAVQSAVARWNSLAVETGVTFVPRSQEKDYVELVSNSAGCFAAVGRVGGPQVLNLDGSCGNIAALHELGHSIGLIHEQQRPDREQNIEVLWQNVDPARTDAWTIIANAAVQTTYDVHSIMHYRAWDGSANGQPVLRLLNAAIPLEQVGANDVTQADIAGVRALYKEGANAFANDPGCVY